MTNDVVLDWLRSLAAAGSARQLYPAVHPRVVAAVDDVHGRALALMAGRDSVALFMVEDRLTCGGQTIHGAGPAAARVFDALVARGYDRITMWRGLTTPEVAALVSALAASDDGLGGASLASSQHLQYAALDTRREPAEPGRLAPGSAPYTHQLTEVWKRIDQQRVVDGEALERLVLPLVEIATRHGGGLLPLARLESHDAYTAAHIANVALLTTTLAEVMGLPSPAVRDVAVAALLHDIGKLRVPASVLNSAGRLSPEELVLMRRHPETGARMLASTPGLPALAPIVAFEHHLQAGGGGYPSVPTGWRINPGSAMTHVADVYDAMRTDRPLHRKALDHHEIIEMMLRDRRTVFDADVLDAFFEYVVPRTELGDAVAVSPMPS